jgi:hypothetical protein
MMSCLFAPRSALLRQESCLPAGGSAAPTPRPPRIMHPRHHHVIRLVAWPSDPSIILPARHASSQRSTSVYFPLSRLSFQRGERDKRSLEKRERWATSEEEGGWKDDESWILLSAFAFCWRNHGQAARVSDPCTSSSVSLSRRCRPVRVRARVVCLPGVEWSRSIIIRDERALPSALKFRQGECSSTVVL